MPERKSQKNTRSKSLGTVFIVQVLLPGVLQLGEPTEDIPETTSLARARQARIGPKINR